MRPWPGVADARRKPPSGRDHQPRQHAGPVATVRHRLDRRVFGYAGAIQSNRTNRRAIEAADERTRTELTAKRAEQFRDEVATVLVERHSISKAAIWAASAVRSHQIDAELNHHTSESLTKFFNARNEYLPQFNRLEQLAIRASLFTNDTEAMGTLDAVREVADKAKSIFDVDEGTDPIDVAHDVCTDLDNEFKRLETVTRRLSTEQRNVLNPTAAQTVPRRWWQPWRQWPA